MGVCVFFPFVRSLNITLYLCNNHSLYTKLNNTHFDGTSILCIHIKVTEIETEKDKNVCINVWVSGAFRVWIDSVTVQNIQKLIKKRVKTEFWAL